MDYIKHKCIECKNNFYCYDTPIRSGCLCFKQLMRFKTSIFSDSEHHEFIYCCSEQCNDICIKEIQKPINKHYIKRIKDNYEKSFNMFIEFIKFMGVLIYFYFLTIFGLNVFHALIHN